LQDIILAGMKWHWTNKTRRPFRSTNMVNW